MNPEEWKKLLEILYGLMPSPSEEQTEISASADAGDWTYPACEECDLDSQY